MQVLVIERTDPSEWAGSFLHQAGLDADTFDRTMQELCEDLLALAAKRRAGVVDIDAATLDAVLGEVRDPLLQICLFKTMLDIADADARLDDREALPVRRAARRWFLHAHEAHPAALDARRRGERRWNSWQPCGLAHRPGPGWSS